MAQQKLADGYAAAGGDQGTAGGFALDRVRDALRDLRYGTVTVIVQDGVVVQVDRTERLRLLRRAQE